MSTSNTTIVQNAVINNTTINQEGKMQDDQKIQHMKQLVGEINDNHMKLKKGELKTDKMARAIGMGLLMIEKEELYKEDFNKKGDKKIKNMAEFITKNFEFSYQYGIMLKQSAKVQKTLNLNDKVSFRLLRSLNRYADKPEALKNIWQKATAESKTPDKKQLEKAIEEWEKIHPDDAYQTSKKHRDLDAVLTDKKSTLKDICSALVKLEPSTISEEIGETLIEKIKNLLHQKNKAAA